MNIKISYQTQMTPVPDAFACVFDLSIDEKVKIEFSLAYLDREQTSVTELQENGYTENDDFSWKGTLGSNWIKPIKELIMLEKAESPTVNSYIHVELNNEILGFPKNEAAADLILNELLQAVMEASEREPPLKIAIINEQLYTWEFEWVFSMRHLFINQKEATAKWQDAFKLMEIIYSIDFSQRKPLKKKCKRSIRFEDKFYFEIKNKQKWNELQAHLRTIAA